MSGTQLEGSQKKRCEVSPKIIYVFQNYPKQDGDDYLQIQRELEALIENKFPDWLEIRDDPNLIAALCRRLGCEDQVTAFEELLTVISKLTVATQDPLHQELNAAANAKKS